MRLFERNKTKNDLSIKEYLLLLILENSKIQIFCKSLFMHSIKLKILGIKFL